jgi:hypothetical protein
MMLGVHPLGTVALGQITVSSSGPPPPPPEILSAEVCVREVFQIRSPVGLIENILKSGNVGIQATLTVTVSGSIIVSSVAARVGILEVP